jgi:hypothetical protein
MADEATPQGAVQAGAPVPATPAVATPPIASPTPPVETPPQYDGGFTKADFDHPEYGTKARNLYQGFQKATTRAAEIEKESAQSKAALEELRTLVQRNPSLREAITAAYEGRSIPKGPEQAPAEEETEEQKLRREISEENESKLNARMAMRDTYVRLGNGNALEGEKLFREKFHDKVNANLDRINRASASDLLDIALKLAQMDAPQPTTNAPATPPPPEPSVRGETRGDGGTGPEEVPPKSDSPEYLAWVLRKSGCSDVGDFLAQTGAYGR